MLVNSELISIVVPVYNVSLYIDQCVKSVVLQTYKNIEIILVNDGSTDDSLEKCYIWEKKDNRIKVVDQANLGLSGARNTGIENSKGKYIVFLDSDDWLNHNAIKVSFEFLIENQCDLVMWQMTKEYENHSVRYNGPFIENSLFKGASLEQLKMRILGPAEDELKEPNKIDSFSSAWGKMYKSHIIKKNNLTFIDTKRIGSEDILFNFYYFQYCNNIGYLHDYLIHYRKNNPTSLTRNHGSTLFPRFINLFNDLAEGIKYFNYGEKYQIRLNNRIAISMMNLGLSVSGPRNQRSFLKKWKDITKYLSHPMYKKAYENFELHHLPIHWRLFYTFCKLELSFLVLVSLYGMRFFIRK
jgi:glycosyltransferase involved in cell wall biosynthesis